MSTENTIREAFETLENGNVKAFKTSVKKMRKLTVALLLIAAEDEPNTKYIQNKVVDALNE